MRRGGIETTSSVCLIIASLALCAVTSGQSIPSLSQPQKQVAFSNPEPKGSVSPFFNHGYLIQFKQSNEIEGQPNIYLYNSSGQLEHQDAIWPANGVKLFLASVDVGASKQLAFSGESTRGDGTKEAFVAIADLDGKNAKYFGTAKYLATQVAVANDGSVWTIGGEYASSENWPKRWDNYDLLRHYGSDGTFLESFLPRWGSEVAFVVETATSNGKQDLAYDNQGIEVSGWKSMPGYRGAANQRNHITLRTIDNGLILYNGSNGEVYRWDTTSKTLSKWRTLGAFDDMALRGVAILSDGEIFASRFRRTTKAATIGFYKLVLESNGVAEWKTLSESTTILPNSPQSFQVLGADRNDIVYKIGNSFPVAVYWSTVLPVK